MAHTAARWRMRASSPSTRDKLYRASMVLTGADNASSAWATRLAASTDRVRLTEIGRRGR
jgi:hypothetical protein